MTDLRDKIAAVQREHRLVTRMVGRKAEKSCLCGWRSPERDCTFTDHPEHVADAVIRYLDSHGWLIDPESGDRARLARAKQTPAFRPAPRIWGSRPDHVEHQPERNR